MRQVFWNVLALVAAVLAVSANAAGPTTKEKVLEHTTKCNIGTANCQTCTLENGFPKCFCSRKDYAFWMTDTYNFGYDKVLLKCTPQMTFNPGDTSCLKEADPFKGMTDSCLGCFYQIYNCTTRFCPSTCAKTVFTDGEKSPECRKCVIDNCEAGFQGCAGFGTTSCPEQFCFTPDPVTIIKGLDDSIFYGIVAGVAGLFFFLFGCIVYRFCTKDTQEYELDEIDGAGTAFQVPSSMLTPQSTIKASSQSVKASFASSVPSTPTMSPPPGLVAPPPGLGGSRVNSFDSFDMDYFDPEDRPDI